VKNQQFGIVLLGQFQGVFKDSRRGGREIHTEQNAIVDSVTAFPGGLPRLIATFLVISVVAFIISKRRVRPLPVDTLPFLANASPELPAGVVQKISTLRPVSVLTRRQMAERLFNGRWLHSACDMGLVAE
jgi:hypothetical protein